jgi:tetratricopeptide (TPR) repeat protein
VNAALVVALLLLSPAAASADARWSGEVPAKARALAERGRALHDSGDYTNAIVAFTQAYAMAPSPALLFNLAQAYRLQGDCDDAALMYRRYLATNPTPDRGSLAEAQLANMERCIHKLALHIPVETAHGTLVPPPPIIATTIAPESSKARIEKDVGIGMMAGGTVALGLTVYYAVQAHNASNDVSAAYAHGARWNDVAPLDSRGRSATRSAQISGGGAALGLAGGLAVYLLGRHTEQAAPLTVSASGHGAEVAMSWAF